MIYDPPSEAKLANVHPKLRDKVHAAMEDLARQGTFFRVAQGLRSFEEQDALYSQGRTAPGHVVTNARGGQSNHNFGYAVDCYPFLSGAAGDLNWNSRSPQFGAMVTALRAQGLVWGGVWPHMPDAPHFQLGDTPVNPTDRDREDYAKGGLAEVWSRYNG